MKNRPFLVRVLSLIFMVIPVIALIAGCFTWGISPLDYLRRISDASPANLAEFLFLLPLAGLALFLMKRWSFYLFIVLIVLITYRNVSFASLLANRSGISDLVLLGIANLSVIAYVLKKDVKKPFFDPRLRWWENLPRYEVRLPCEIRSADRSVPCEILNVSRGGVLALTLSSEAVPFDAADILEIEFKTNDDSTLCLKARIAHLRAAGITTYGLQFLEMNPAVRQALKKFVKSLKKTGSRRVNPPDSMLDQFKTWCRS